MMPRMPGWSWWMLLAANVCALALFAWDKLMARLDRRRISERALLSFTFLGCLGAWTAMWLFRHKTRKSSFRWRAIALTVVNPLWLALWAQLR